MNIKVRELRSYMIEENLGVYEMLQEIPAIDEFEQTNSFNGKTKYEVIKMIHGLTMNAYGFNTDDWDCPQAEAFVMFIDDKPVCIGGLTLKLTPFWEKHRGHIWYKTRPTERKKGFCIIFVNELIKISKTYGYSKLIAQCNVLNVPSNKILKNTGFELYENKDCLDMKNTNFYKLEINETCVF